MGKQQVTMTIDSDVAEEFQRIFPHERSSYCNEMMRLKIASTKGDVSGLKLDLLLHKETELKEKSSILTAELVGISEQIRMVKDNQSKIKEIQLKEEQARLETLTKCDGCSLQMKEVHIEAGGEKFCKQCFMSDNQKCSEALKRDKK